MSDTIEVSIERLRAERDHEKRVSTELIADLVSCQKALEELDTLRAERDRLREALEEACRCNHCGGDGWNYAAVLDAPPTQEQCRRCEGAGRDYHGSAKARAVLEGKP